MNFQNFKKAGHPPTLLGAFLYFDVSFMIWILLGALGAFIVKDFSLTALQKGFLVSIPLLGGSILRLPMGFLSDKLGSKKVALWGMALTAVPLTLLFLFGKTLPELYVLGLFLGIAGASFAVALPMVSRWYPAEYQGLVLGIAGAGNSGTVLAAFFAPRLAEHFGWHAVFGLALIPLALVAVYFSVFTKDSPHKKAPPSREQYKALLKEPDSMLFCVFYMMTFGGFVGMASFLPIFLNDQYDIPKIMIGNLTALCVMSGSFCRPLGGYISDKLGGTGTLSFLYVGVAICLSLAAGLPALPVMIAILFVCMMFLGMGNGAVFQIIPQRFPNQMGTITGLVGSAGGIGGFLLPLVLGGFKDRTGSYGPGFWTLTIAFVGTLIILRMAQYNWKRTWILGQRELQ